MYQSAHGRSSVDDPAAVGIDHVVERIEARRPLSRNRSPEHVAGVADDLPIHAGDAR